MCENKIIHKLNVMKTFQAKTSTAVQCRQSFNGYTGVKGFLVKHLLTLILLCVAMNIWAQQVINLNDETTKFGFEAVAANTVYQDFFSEAKMSRTFKINPALQSANNISVGDIVNLQLFEDNNYTATISSITTDVNGTLTIMLKLSDYPMAVAFITTSSETKSLVSVSIPEQDKIFVSRGSIYSDNSYLIEIDKTDILPLINDAIEIPDESEEIIIEGENSENVQRQRAVAPATISCSPNTSLLPTDPAQIDILMVYTPAAATWAASNGGINSIIASAMAQTSAVIDNQRNGDSFNLVHSQQVAYTEEAAGYDMSTDLDRLTNTNDGYMDEVHQLRKQYNADIVVLITLAYDYGGLGWVLSNVNGNYANAFNVVRVQQISYTTTSIHEIGHNMGMLHEVENNSISPPLFPYAYGWYWTGTDSKVYGSVMSYTGIESPYFSNPNETHYGAATGTSTANNAQVFRNTKHAVAFYSDRIQNLPDAPTDVVVSNPTNNGATISWNEVDGAISYRVIGPNGTSYFTTSNPTYSLNYSSWYPLTCTSYQFSIQAVNECGDLSDRYTSTFTTKCPTDPTVTTESATNITTTTATLNKTVTANGATVTAQGFMYKAETSSTWLTSATGNLTGLTLNTAYQFYAYATTASGTVNGLVKSFTTSACNVTEQLIYNVETRSGFSGGWYGAELIIKQNGVQIQTVSLATFAPTTSPVIVPVPLCPCKNIDFVWIKSYGDYGCSFVIKDNLGNTIFQSPAYNTSDTGAGCAEYANNQTVFNTGTTGCFTAPTVTTQAATAVMQTTATLNKTVAQGSETITEQGFKYKMTSDITWQTSTTGSLTGLTPNAQYQFYAYATTATDTYNGSTLTFKTQCQIYNHSESAEVCYGESYLCPDNTLLTNITAPTSHTNNLLSINDCDSIVVTNLTVKSLLTKTLDIDICAGESYDFYGTLLTENVTDSVHRFSNLDGCDSVVYFNLRVLPTFTSEKYISIFEHEIYNGQTYHFGDYTFIDTLTAENSCDSIVTTYLHVEESTGFNLIKADNISIYPNPAKDDLFIINNEQVTINNVKITDIAGKTIVNLKSKIPYGFSSVNQINVSTLPHGVYLIKIYTDKGVVIKRFIKN